MFRISKQFQFFSSTYSGLTSLPEAQLPAASGEKLVQLGEASSNASVAAGAPKEAHFETADRHERGVRDK